MIKVLIVDDHELMREGLKQLFEKSTNFQVIATLGSAEALIDHLQQERCDLIMLDISMPGVDCFELTQRISSNPEFPPILAVTKYDDIDSARRMFKSGAKGYITKNNGADELIKAVRKVALGGKYVDSEVSEQIFFSQKKAISENPHALLSTHELSILKLIVSGKKITEIAHQYELSVKTVSTHKSNIKKKLSIDNDADLIRYAMKSLI